MILWTYERCIAALPRQDVFIATDDERIAATCRAAGAQVLMTRSDCLTGTDRIAEAANQVAADVYINVQGDEPLMDPADISAIVAAAHTHPHDIINGMAPIDDEDEFRRPSVPKVVAAPDGRLLYMSRAAIPTTKSLGFAKAYKQICVYAFPRAALAAFAAKGVKTPLEAVEDIEILRFLELGYAVRMVSLSSVSIAVDLQEDVGRAEAALRAELSAAGRGSLS
jgi:3-deoxy-manno-octulosonate cytidylyltransferase (CMP-KDO synthetase)